MTYPGTTREIRFGDAVQIVDREEPRDRLIGRIVAKTALGENEFYVQFGNGDQIAYEADQFQWVGSPRPQAQQELRSQIRNRERMD